MCALLCFCMFPNAAAASNADSAFHLQTAEGDGKLTISLTAKNLVDAYAFEVQLEFDSLRLQWMRAETSVSGFTVSPVVKGNRILFAHTKIGNASGIVGDAELVKLTFQRIRGGEAAVHWRTIKLIDSALDMSTLNPEIGAVFTSGLKPVQMRDIAGHWAEKNIDAAVELGFARGYQDGTFRPDNPITRAEFATLLTRALMLEGQSSASFADAALIPDWAASPVAAAARAGIVEGYDNGEFRPFRLIDRSELAVMIVRALGVQTDTGYASLTFADAGQIPSWAGPSVQLAVEHGLVKGRGDNRFAPLAQATRAEAITIILDLLDKLTASEQA